MEVYAIRAPKKYYDRSTEVLWAKAERQTVYTYKDKWQLKRVDTTLYKDADCTQKACELARSNPRIMKRGVFHMTNYPAEYCTIIVVDNAVRKSETDRTCMKYDYKE